MLTARVERAIVGILADGASVGTGFLATADGWVLTARHVVEPHALASIEIEFLDGTRATVSDRALGGTEDWAALKIDGHAPARPMPMSPLRYSVDTIRWLTAGHSNLRKGGRGNFHGTVRGKLPHVDLYCEELDGKKHEDAKGLSGAPVIVEGRAVALITSVRYKNDSKDIVAAQVNALELSAIHPGPFALALGEGPPLAFEALFAAPLQTLETLKFNTVATIAKLADDDFAGMAKSVAAQVLARRILHEGMATSADAVGELSGEISDDTWTAMANAVECLWVSETAADNLAVISEGTRFAWLKTVDGECARQYWRRAYGTRGAAGKKSWHSVEVKPGGTPYEEGILRATYAAFTRQYPRLTSERRVQLLVGDPNERCAVFIHDAFHRNGRGRRVVELLHKEMPRLTIVFLSRVAESPSTEALTEVTIIQPEVTEDEEAASQDMVAVAQIKMGRTK